MNGDGQKSEHGGSKRRSTVGGMTTGVVVVFIAMHQVQLGFLDLMSAALMVFLMESVKPLYSD